MFRKHKPHDMEVYDFIERAFWLNKNIREDLMTAMRVEYIRYPSDADSQKGCLLV